MKKLPWTWFDHRADLPKWLFSDIGRIAVEWSMLERELEETIRLTANVSIRTGRIITTGMTLRSRFAVARDFLQSHVYHNDLDPAFLDEIADLENRIKEIANERNLVVHGLWDKRKRTWHVLRTTGTRKEPDLRPAIKKFSRAVLPKSEKITPTKTRTIIQKIIRVNADIVNLCNRLEAALPTSPYKSPPYTRKRHPPPRRTK